MRLPRAKNLKLSENMYLSTTYHLPKTPFQYIVTQLRYSVVPNIVTLCILQVQNLTTFIIHIKTVEYVYFNDFIFLRNEDA